MIRVNPPTFTASDIASMLELLERMVPYIDAENRRAYFPVANSQNLSFPDIFVALRDGEGESFARRTAVEGIAALPDLHAQVVDLPDDLNDSDEYAVSHLDIDHGEIDVVYVGSVNALWHNPFRQDSKGRWRLVL